MRILTVWHPSFSLALTAALFHLFCLGIAVGLSALLGNRYLKLASANARYLFNLFLLAALFLCVPVVLTQQFAASKGSESHSDLVQTIPADQAAGIDPRLLASPRAGTSGNEHEIGKMSFTGPSVVQSRSIETAPPVAVSVRNAVAPWIAGGYCIGFLAMLARLLAALLGGNRLRRRACPVDEPSVLDLLKTQARAIGLRMVPAVAYCENVAVPVVVGVLRPIILLPILMARNLTPQQLRDVLTHELAHIWRLDHIVVLLQRLTEVVWFFHPAVWYLSRQLSREREHCCDDLVLAAGAQRISYADTLCRVAELTIARDWNGSPPVVLAADGRQRSQLRRRIIRLLEIPPQQSTVQLTRSGVLGLTAMLAVLCLPPFLLPAVNGQAQALIAGDEKQRPGATDNARESPAAQGQAANERGIAKQTLQLPVGPDGLPKLAAVLDAWDKGIARVQSYEVYRSYETTSYREGAAPFASLPKPRHSQKRFFHEVRAGRQWRVEPGVAKPGDKPADEQGLEVTQVWNGELAKTIIPKLKQFSVAGNQGSMLGSYEWFYAAEAGVPWTDMMRQRPGTVVERLEGDLVVIYTPTSSGKPYHYSPFGYRIWLDSKKNFLPAGMEQLLDLDHARPISSRNDKASDVRPPALENGTQIVYVRFDNTLQEISPAVFAPMKSVILWYPMIKLPEGAERKEASESVMTVDRKLSRINVPIDQSLFQLEVPLGFWVGDDICHRTYEFGKANTSLTQISQWVLQGKISVKDYEEFVKKSDVAKKPVGNEVGYNLPR
jgi:beta-lactamase regulating signal transducer with metallopeptidase domain